MVKVESYTQRGRDRIVHEAITSDVYQTEHKNFDGSVLNVRVTEVNNLEPDASGYSPLMSAYEEYIKILNEEIDSLIGLANVHGWKSKLVEQGIEARKKIAELKRQISANASSDL